MPDLLESTEVGITTRTLNRPQRLNPMAPAIVPGLRQALHRLATDHSRGADCHEHCSARLVRRRRRHDD